MPKQIPVWGGYVNQVWPVHLTHLSTGTYTFVILECYRFWNLMLLIFPPNLSLCVTSLSAIFSAEPKEKIYIFSHLSYNILDSLFTQGHILKPITEEISWDTQLNLEELLYRTDRTTKTLSISGEMPVKVHVHILISASNTFQRRHTTEELLQTTALVQTWHYLYRKHLLTQSPQAKPRGRNAWCAPPLQGHRESNQRVATCPLYIQYPSTRTILQCSWDEFE